MATMPDELPMWATMTVIDPTSNQPNVSTPPPEKQLVGWSLEEQPPRQWFNWLGQKTYEWLVYFKDRDLEDVTTSGDGVTPNFDALIGGLCYIYVVDTVVTTNCYHGMCYLPPGNVGATFIDIKKVGITTPTISATGTVTIAGGTGPFIVSTEQKNIPS